MKRFLLKTFGFTEEQLWGPSEMRNGVDSRFDNNWRLWSETRHRLRSDASWFVEEVLPDLDDAEHILAVKKLVDWGNEITDTKNRSGITPRKVLQSMGTEWGRAVSRDVWSNYAKTTAFKLLGGGYSYNRVSGLVTDATSNPNFVVITDGRFRNEIVNVLAVGGSVWDISSPKVLKEDNAAVEAAGIKGHASEAELKSVPLHFFTNVFVNNKSAGLDFCEKKVVERMVNEWGTK